MYFIDIDTNGELDCNFTQLPFEALASDAADLPPTATAVRP